MVGGGPVVSPGEALRAWCRRAAAAAARHPAATDAATAVLLAAAALVSVYADIEFGRAADPLFRPPGTAAVVVAMLALTLPLAWRRRFPLTSLVAVIAAFLAARLVLDVNEASVTVLASSLALYSAAAHGRRGPRGPVIAVALGAILAEVVRETLFAGGGIPGQPVVRVFYLAYNAVFLALPCVLGATISSLRRRQRQLAEQAAELRREREENARRAVFEERVRIARELHDVVAHHVSLMGVQAGAARRVLQRQPDKAQEALTAIETASRQAVLELHRLLGFLRRAGDTDQLAPQPGLAQLEDLLGEAARAGLVVDLAIEGRPCPLSPTLELSAYRVIQEALTNTRKHSGAGTASVRLAYRPSALELQVLDDGGRPTGSRPAGDGPGQGLIGMRERASLHGGHVSVGPRPEGGFAVQAVFPLEPAVP
jgi:signal transduction histidine kinase